MLPIAGVTDANASSLPFSCIICNGVSFKSQKALDQHCRIKHNVRSSVAPRLPNISVCPVCFTQFDNRSRLLTHLSETRVRSRTGNTSCKAEFLKLPRFQCNVEGVEASKIQAEQNKHISSARKLGHSHVLANVPARRGSNSVLKGAKWKPRHLLRRITGKSSSDSLRNRYPSRSNSFAIIAHGRFMSQIEFGKIRGGIGLLANVIPITTFSRPPKIRRVSVKGLGAADVVSLLK